LCPQVCREQGQENASLKSGHDLCYRMANP